MRLVYTFIFCAASLWAQLSPQQKQQDFLGMAGTFNKQYGPYEWKRQILGFDMLDVQPWLARIAASKDDLEYLDICQEYTASLRDGHVAFIIPSTYNVQLPIAVDIYDGRVLIEGLTRGFFPLATYPFVVGDEIVSVDGEPVSQVLSRLERYAGSLANPRASRRAAADFLFFRPQSRIPGVPNLAETVSFGVRRRGASSVETYEARWIQNGEPLRTLGLVPTLSGSRAARILADATPAPRFTVEGPPWRQMVWQLGYSADDYSPADLDPTVEVFHGVSGRGATLPYYALPPGFVRRVGLSNADNFLTGTYTANGKRLGYVRIPRMTPNNFTLATTQLASELAFLQANTDGLVVDVTRNPGGLIEYGHALAEYFVSTPQNAVGFQLRATASRISTLSSQVAILRAQGAPPWAIALFQNVLNDVRLAYQENRGLTGTLPIDRAFLEIYPAVDANGNPAAYTKPMIVLVDEFSVSTADLFPAVLQDAGRAKIVGYRTGGLGGTNGSLYAGAYSETTVGVTFGLMVRPKAIAAEGFPVTQFIENVGVRPDIELDYMTTDNLLQFGLPFVNAFTRIISDEIDRLR